MTFKKWVHGKVDKALAKSLAEECEIDPFVALLAVCRGIKDPADIDELLSPDINICGPYTLADMDEAVECVYDAIDKGELIAVYGDYDCDGVVATALLYDYLSTHGANVIYYIPDRFDEGYGMNISAVDKLNAKGVKTIITVDNGINSHKEIDYAVSLGMRVVVTDHHLPTGELPKNAAAVVDPHREGNGACFKEICGAIVAFKLACALDETSPEDMLQKYGDLAAIATIGDIMPLVGENRSIVKYGLKRIANSDRAGILALLEVAGLKGKPLSAGAVSFGLVPCINATGRIRSASLAVELLLEKDLDKALKIADEINGMNATRQTVEAEITAEACKYIEKENLANDRVIVVAGRGWQHGVVGIVASRITEKYARPSIVLSVDGEIAVGSARGVDTFSIFECISCASDILVKFGGHKLAAGLTVKTEDIPLLRRKLNAFAQQYPLYVPQINIDCMLNPAALSVEMAYAVALFEPFGCGNATPVFGLCGLRLDQITPVGNGKHLRLLLSKGGAVIQAIMFSATLQSFGFAVGDVVDVAVSLSVNNFNGQPMLNLTVKNMRISGVNDEQVQTQLLLYDNFIRNEQGDYYDIAPTREDITLVFKTLCGNGNVDSVINRLITNMPLAKIILSCDILTQIGVLKADSNGVLQRVQGVRSELHNSAYYKRLQGGENA